MEPAKETTSDAHANYLATRRLPGLDGIRALSILAVIWHHTSDGLTVLRLDRRGFLGVDLFFVMSGYLIVTLLLRERTRKGEISLKNFYMRRVLRIFPLYFGIVLALWIGVKLVAPTGSTARALDHDLIYLLTYTVNWVDAISIMAIAWSLAAEEQFYLFWPPIERFLGRFAVPILFGLLVLSQVIQLHLLDDVLASLFGWSPDEPAMLRQTTFTPILLGVLLAHAMHAPAWHRRIVRTLGGRHASLVCLALIIAICQFAPEDLSGWPRPVLQLIMTALVAACVLGPESPLGRFLERPFVCRIGVVSYGMYLLHLLVRHVVVLFMAKFGWDLPCAEFLLTTGLTYVAAECSFRYFESPFLKLKTRFA